MGADVDSPIPIENSTLVTTNGQAKIKAYDTRISAWGDNSKPPGISNIESADKKSTSKTLSIGMGDPIQPLANSNTKGITVKNPLRLQKLILPVSGSEINLTAYLTDPNDNVIQIYPWILFKCYYGTNERKRIPVYSAVRFTRDRLKVRC